MAIHHDTRRDDNAAQVGDRLPKALGPRGMAKAFGVSYATFNRLERAGQFKPFLLARPIGYKRYSGERVQSFLNGFADKLDEMSSVA